MSHYRSDHDIFLVILKAFKKSAKPNWLLVCIASATGNDGLLLNLDYCLPT
nr:MAG TPA: hypothetical protein [Caudoviricetes sp.]